MMMSTQFSNQRHHHQMMMALITELCALFVVVTRGPLATAMSLVDNFVICMYGTHSLQ